MELIPTFKEIKGINIFEINYTDQLFLAEHGRLYYIREIVKNHGAVLTSNDLIKLIEYRDQSYDYLDRLINELERITNEKYDINYYENYLEYIDYLLNEFKIDVDTSFNISLICSIGFSVKTEIEIIEEILDYVRTSSKVKLSLENISSENSLLGILLEAVEDSKFSSKEEVIEIVKQELKQLEEHSSFKDNTLTT